MNKRRVLLWIVTVCLLAALLPSTVFAANNGWVQEGNNWCYYQYGSKICDTYRYYIDGKYYGFDANGVMYAGEWITADEGYYYYGTSGEMYHDGVYQIGGKYYGFDWNGRMYNNTTFTFSYYDEVQEKWIYTQYRAKAGGVLYVNEWYQSGSEWYYYGAEGVGADDFTQIGTTWYFFEDAYMIKDQFVWSDKYQANYYISEDGKSNSKAPTNGWLQIGEDYYYFSNNERYRNGVYQIGGKYYGFSWNGRMYDNTTFWVNEYDADGNWINDYQARAAEGGVVYVNAWYQNGDTWYYYGAKGKAPNDFYKVGATWYYFENGRMVKDQIVWSDKYQANYYISKDGKSSSKAPANGWWQAGEDYYYFSNNERYEDGVYQIGGKYYGFDWNGRMYNNTTFSDGYYDEAQGMYVYPYYRAKAGGVLYVNEWYEHDNGDWYYYGAKGVGADDFTQVGTTWYYFENARMIKNRIVWSDKYQANYYISKDGKSSTQAPANGWWQAGEYYYYFSNYEMYRGNIYKIGGKYYGFDWNGQMFESTSFSMDQYDTNGSWLGYYRYRAKDDGTLYVNEWYQSGSEWYYYGAAGKGAEDFTQIGTTWYFFEDAQMVTDSLVYSEKYDAYYTISKDGKSSKQINADGWVFVGDNYYYVGGGELYRARVYQIGGKYYGFNSSGRMYTNTSFWTEYYDATTEQWKYGRFQAKEDGALYVNEWYQSGSTWYYFGQHGLGAEDFTQIGGTWYFFREGEMQKEVLVYSDKYDGYYVISADGKSSKAITTDGWVAVGQKYYYIHEGNLCTEEIRQIGGKYYGFDYEGVMYADTTFGMYNSSTDRSGYYRAKEDGTLYVNTWYQEGDNWSYYGAAGMGYNGKAKADGKWYWFEYARMLKDQTCNDGSAYYAVDKNGYLIETEGKYAVGGRYVYVKADGTLLDDEWKQISGKWHYFTPSMYANQLVTIEEKLYAVDNDGACVAVTGNGIYDIGTNGKVYLENGKISTGWKQVSGSWYYFDTKMHKNGVYEIDDEYYVFDQNGKMFTGGWILFGHGDEWDDDTSYAYADASGKAATGLKTINGKQYYFNDYGYMYSNTTVEVEGVEYIIDASGVATKAKTTGWQYVDGEYYYIKNGELVRDEMIEIGGKRYAFYGSGAMVTNETYWVDGDNLVAAGEDGVIKTGWNQVNGNWYYSGNDGYLLYGKQTINGKKYIFDSSMRVGTFMWDGMIVTTDASGAIISEKDPADGWSYVNGSVMYYQNGQRYTGWVGDYLVKDGYMQVDNWASWEGDRYAFNIDGKYIKSGWYQIRYDVDGYGDYVYAKAGGKLCYNEWLQLGSNWYYFDGVYMLADGTYEVEGKLCKFDANGKYLGTATELSGDGWTKSGGVYYYLHAGKPVVGPQWINGERYVFDWDGEMLCGGFVHMEGDWFYTNDNGTIPNYTGWKLINGEWCYFNSSNLPVLGWFQDNGKVYYGQVKEKNDVLYIGVATGYLYADGDMQYFAADGVHKGTAGIENGWFKANGEWYYFRNGKPVTGYQTIGGKQYFFSSGAMMSDIIWNGRYYAADGVQRTTKGWYKTSEGWIYVGDNGRLYNGVYKFGDKQYYFRDYVWIS